MFTNTTFGRISTPAGKHRGGPRRIICSVTVSRGRRGSPRSSDPFRFRRFNIARGAKWARICFDFCASPWWMGMRYWNAPGMANKEGVLPLLWIAFLFPIRRGFSCLDGRFLRDMTDCKLFGSQFYRLVMLHSKTKVSAFVNEEQDYRKPLELQNWPIAP